MGGVQPEACEDTSSPLKRLRAGTQEELFMKRASKEAAGDALGLKQARIGQPKAGNQARGHHMAEKQPTEREVAAAKAARARLYGGEGSAKVEKADKPEISCFISDALSGAVPCLPPETMLQDV